MARALEPVPAGTPAETNQFIIQNLAKPVLFVGDDATEQKTFPTLIESYVLSRFPTWKTSFRNVGWPGDKIRFAGTRAKSGDQAIRRDIESFHPQVVFANYGINDARGGDLNQFLVGVNVLSRDLPRVGVNRAVFVSANPTEEWADAASAGGIANSELQKFADGMKERFPVGWQDGVDFMLKHPKGPEAPKAENGVFVDVFHPMLKLMEDGRTAGVLSAKGASDNRAAHLTADGVHPNWCGGMIMATIILEALHAPAVVSSATLDAATHTTGSTEGCTIKWQNGPGRTIEFERTDAALPWPIPAECDPTLRIPGFDPGGGLNRYELKVAGLAPGSYQVSIDNVAIGTVSQEGLARGINLGFIRKGPIFDQGQKLLGAVQEKNDTFFHRWHDVQILQEPDPATTPATGEEARKAELSRLDKLVTDQAQAIDKWRLPAPHVYRIESLSRP